MAAPTLDSASSPKAARQSVMWLSPRRVGILLGAWVILRWIFASMVQLVPDEAYYWTWSRRLAMSYFDHPPMVAYLIRLGTVILGNTQLGVRCWAAVLTAGMIAILAWTTRKMIGDARAGVFVALMLLLSPMMSVIGVIVTPDTPMCFFASCALVCALHIFAPKARRAAVGRHATDTESIRLFSTHNGKLWLAFGLFLGLAMLSKYTAVLLGLAVLGAMLSSGDARRHFFTIWPWLGAIVAALVFSPVFIWNAHHHWGSFLFQINHGFSRNTAPPWKNLLDYLGGQTLIATPAFFLLLLFVLAAFWRRRGNPMHVRILLFSTTLPLLFFTYSALHKHVEANWPLFAYLPGTMLIGLFLSENWSRRRVFWAEAAMKVALVGAILIHTPQLFWAINPKWSTPQWDALFGWQQLAANVNIIRASSPVFTTDYEYASELSFYLPGQPEVWPLPDASRPTAFDFSPGRPDPQSFDRVLIVRRGQFDDVDWRIKPYFDKFEFRHFQLFAKQRAIRASSITVASK